MTTPVETKFGADGLGGAGTEFRSESDVVEADPPEFLDSIIAL
jgi:hypothetical protein